MGHLIPFTVLKYSGAGRAPPRLQPPLRWFGAHVCTCVYVCVSACVCVCESVCVHQYTHMCAWRKKIEWGCQVVSQWTQVITALFSQIFR